MVKTEIYSMLKKKLTFFLTILTILANIRTSQKDCHAIIIIFFFNIYASDANRIVKAICYINNSFLLIQKYRIIRDNKSACVTLAQRPKELLEQKKRSIVAHSTRDLLTYCIVVLEKIKNWKIVKYHTTLLTCQVSSK